MKLALIIIQFMQNQTSLCLHDSNINKRVPLRNQYSISPSVDFALRAHVKFLRERPVDCIYIYSALIKTRRRSFCFLLPVKLQGANTHVESLMVHVLD